MKKSQAITFNWTFICIYVLMENVASVGVRFISVLHSRTVYYTHTERIYLYNMMIHSNYNLIVWYGALLLTKRPIVYTYVYHYYESCVHS